MKTLGISLGHDSGVALLEDHKIVFAANEERFSRIKGHSGIPHLCLQYLEQSDLLNEISAVAIDGKWVAPHGNDSAYRFEASSNRLQDLAESMGIDRFFLNSKFGTVALLLFHSLSHLKKRSHQKSLIRNLISHLEVRRIDHHMAHAASIAFPRREAQFDGLVITLDGIGEGICSRVLELKNGKLSKLGFVPALGSPALMYGYATKILGYRINRHEGKLTGLAAYGNPEETSEIFLRHFKYHDMRFLASKIGYGPSAITNLQKKLKLYAPEDVAAGVQLALEKLVTSYIQSWIEKTNLSRIYLSGGAFANVKLNQRIAEIDGIEDLVVAPNMGDGGLALGAAALVHDHSINLDSLYLGTPIEEDPRLAEMKQIVYSGKAFHPIVARLLASMKIVALARGKMEYGPRALGNRSILYSAQSREVNSWLNTQLKRTEFMPFAPICRDVDAHKNFLMSLPLDRYKHMTITCEVTNYCRETAPAIVHVDGTARPQIISKNDNPDVYEILTEYSKLVENPILVNTSFNMHEEPIVRTLSEALDAFQLSGIDYLLVNNFIIQNKRVITN